MFRKDREIFSIRKLQGVVGSVVIGGFVFGGGQVLADEAVDASVNTSTEVERGG